MIVAELELELEIGSGWLVWVQRRAAERFPVFDGNTKWLNMKSRNTTCTTPNSKQLYCYHLKNKNKKQ